ncbi:hypothetical protein [Atlantibacter subterraneus]|nr:hypothetical protein [Atlantibacter subterranea]
MARLIVLLDVDDEEGVKIATDQFGDTVTFNTWHEADDWCARNTRGRWVKTVNLDDDDDDDDFCSDEDLIKAAEEIIK